MQQIFDDGTRGEIETFEIDKFKEIIDAGKSVEVGPMDLLNHRTEIKNEIDLINEKLESLNDEINKKSILDEYEKLTGEKIMK